MQPPKIFRFHFAFHIRYVEMTLSIASITEFALEKTDLGPSVSFVVEEWINGGKSGKCLAAIMSFALESSVRLRIPDCDSRTTWIDFAAGGISATVARSIDVYDNWFQYSSDESILRAYSIMGLSMPRQASEVNITRINSSFRRLSLKSRWASTITDSVTSMDESTIDLPSLHIAMELIRGHVRSISTVRKLTQTTQNQSDDGLVLRELRSDMPLGFQDLNIEEIQDINARIEDYLISLMKLKSTGLELIAELQESRIYSILGIASTASDSEVKRAYKIMAMQLHPDKGGDTELFQQLTDAYERILERRGINKNVAEPAAESVTTVNREKAEPQCEKPKPPESRGAGDEPSSVFMKILKSADDCVKSAKLASELTSKIAASMTSQDISENHQFRALIVMFIKSVRICGYACLDTSSAALDAARSLSDTVSTERVSTVTNIAGELMNAGFDSLNASVECDRDILKRVTEAAGKAIDNARLATKLAKAVEALSNESEEPSSPILLLQGNDKLKAAVQQRACNQEILRKLTSEIKDQQTELCRISMSGNIPHVEWVTCIFCDILDNALRSTEKRFEASILVRTPDQITQVFKSECSLFRLNDELPISTDPLNRICRLMLCGKNEVVIDQVNRIVVPFLVRLVLKRNRLVSQEDATQAVLALLSIRKLEDWKKVYQRKPSSNLAMLLSSDKSEIQC